jgi:hypothetical protein
MRPNHEFGGQLMSKINVTEHFEIEGVASKMKKTLTKFTIKCSLSCTKGDTTTVNIQETE